MVAIFITILVAVLGLGFLFVFLFRSSRSTGEAAGGAETRPAVAGLSAACVSDFELVFRSEDYRKLRSRPELRPVSKQFWRDRRRIALMWLQELHTDVTILWELRRFLVGSGLHVTLGDEASVASVALAAVVYLRAVQATVFVFGPFATFRTLRNAKLLVEELSSVAAGLLARVPAPRKEEIEELWARRLQALRAAG
jgi:hypothetical protein